MKSKNLLWISMAMLAALLLACAPVPLAFPPGTNGPRVPVGDAVWLQKRLTQCADEWQEWVANKYAPLYKVPWEENAAYNLNLMEQGIVQFYSDRGITIRDIRLVELPPEPACEACNCPGSKRLEIFTDEVSYFLGQG